MKFTNIPILNRGDLLPDDGWYHIVPMGEFKVRRPDGAVILQVIDDRAIAAMVERFQGEAMKLLVDYDHFSYDEGHKSEAAGWIVEVEARTDGLWARIEWTDAGQPAIVNKRYRFVSPVWLPSECEKIADNQLRPMRLDSVGLTNQPNMKGMQPLSNRGGEDKMQNSHRNKEHSMKKVLEQLGLSADATEESAIAAVTALKNRAAEADALLNRAETAEKQVKQIESEQLEAAAEAFCETHKAVIVNRDVVKQQFIANRAATEALIGGLKATKEDPKQDEALINRAKKQPVTGDAAAENQKASAIRNRAHQIAKEQGVTFPVAFDRAQAEAKAG